MIETEKLAQIIEAILMTAGEPVTETRLLQCFPEESVPTKEDIQAALAILQASYEQRSFLIQELASGYIIQAKQEYAPYIIKLWEEKPSKYSRAYLETLVIIAYRQPITRAEIENIRGVAVSTSIMKTLLEREWVKVIGHRDVPGKPSLYGTTKTFLDYFNLKSLSELPTLQEIEDLDKMAAKLQEQFNFEPTAEAVSLEEAPSADLAEMVETALETPVPESLAENILLDDAPEYESDMEEMEAEEELV